MKLHLRAIAGLLLICSLSACGGEPAVMPDLSAQRLDVALSDLERAGYDDEPEVLGGGMFGIVDESNWVVCEQEPAAGKTVTGTPRLTVERTCDKEEEESASGDESDSDSAEAASAPETSKPEAETKPKRKVQAKPRAAKRQPVSDTFTMPLLVGANLQDAQDHLQSLGSFLLTQNDATGMGRFQMFDANWKVCGQIPAPGARVSIARLVDLRVVKLHEGCP